MHGLARQGDVAVEFEPVRFVVRRKLAHQFALRIEQPGLLLKGRVDFQETVIHWFAVRIKYHFNRAEAFDQRFKKRLVSRFRVMTGFRHLRHAAFLMDLECFGRMRLHDLRGRWALAGTLL